MIRDPDDKIQIQRDGKFIPCAVRFAFLMRDKEAYIETLIIRQDGAIELAGECYSFDDIKDMTHKGYLKTRIKDKDSVIFKELCALRAKQVRCYVNEPDLVKDIGDVIRKLNGLPTSLDLCVEAYEVYMNSQTDNNREALRIAFSAIPEHRDVYLSGFDRMDVRIRKILGEA